MPCSTLRRTKVDTARCVEACATGEVHLLGCVKVFDAFTLLHSEAWVYAWNDITAAPAVLLRHYIPSYTGSIARNPQVQQDQLVVSVFFRWITLFAPCVSPFVPSLRTAGPGKKTVLFNLEQYFVVHA